MISSIIRQGFLLILLTTVLAGITYFMHPEAPEWNPGKLAEGEVSIAWVKALDDSVLWVDAREKEAYENKSIPAAIWVSESDWNLGLTNFLERWEQGQKVIVYCDGGDCHSSQVVMDRLRRDTGIETIYYLEGGFPEWEGQFK